MVSQFGNKRSGFRKMILLLLLAGIAMASFSPVSAGTGVTIAAQGDQKYYLGEEVVVSGQNDVSDFTYLFITGPEISGNGGKLTSPRENSTSGDPGSFVRVSTQPDRTWEYTLYTHNLGVNPGPYTVYAVSEPKPKDQLGGVSWGNVSIILMRPFVTAEIAPSPVIPGEPFTVTGYAEGNPAAVQLWIIGDTRTVNATAPVQPNSSYSCTLGPETTGHLPGGRYYLVAQHPMQNNQLDIVVGGDYVRNLQLQKGNESGSTTVFRIAGAGSFKGRDAAHALVTVLSDPTVDDTYTEVPFLMTDTGKSPQTQPVTTIPWQQQTPTAPLRYAPLAALGIIIGVIAWGRR